MSANNAVSELATVSTAVPVLRMVPTRDEIMRVLNLDQRKPETMALVLTCERYGLDPILKHAVLIQGTLYVTRDGLMHVAHVNGQFDGLEVTQLPDTQTHYVAQAKVWRKDMSRPFVFQGRFPKNKPMAKDFGPEMAEKVAVCRALRHGFDVSLCSREETWEQDDAPIAGDMPRHQSPQGPPSARSPQPLPKALSAPVQPTQQKQAPIVNDARMQSAKRAFTAAAEAVGYQFADGADRLTWLNRALERDDDSTDGFTAENIEKAALALPDMIIEFLKAQKPEGHLPEAYLPETEAGEADTEASAEAADGELTDPFAETEDAKPELPKKTTKKDTLL